MFRVRNTCGKFPHTAGQSMWHPLFLLFHLSHEFHFNKLRHFTLFERERESEREGERERECFSSILWKCMTQKYIKKKTEKMEKKQKKEREGGGKKGNSTITFFPSFFPGELWHYLDLHIFASHVSWHAQRYLCNSGEINALSACVEYC